MLDGKLDRLTVDEIVAARARRAAGPRRDHLHDSRVSARGRHRDGGSSATARTCRSSSAARTSTPSGGRRSRNARRSTSRASARASTSSCELAEALERRSIRRRSSASSHGEGGEIVADPPRPPPERLRRAPVPGLGSVPSRLHDPAASRTAAVRSVRLLLAQLGVQAPVPDACATCSTRSSRSWSATGRAGSGSRTRRSGCTWGGRRRSWRGSSPADSTAGSVLGADAGRPGRRRVHRACSRPQTSRRSSSESSRATPRSSGRSGRGSRSSRSSTRSRSRRRRPPRLVQVHPRPPERDAGHDPRHGRLHREVNPDRLSVSIMTPFPARRSTRWRCEERAATGCSPVAGRTSTSTRAACWSSRR